MDPVIILPLALAVAWAATRKKKTPKSTTSPPSEPEVVDTPPLDGPGGQEPWRPGGPQVPTPDPYDGPVGPKPFPGPSGGPKPPQIGDPSPTEIYPGTTPQQIEEHEHASYGLFISSDCGTVYEGEHWYDEVFLPQARELVLGNPEAFHHPNAVIYELLVVPQLSGEIPETPPQTCVAAWGEFQYGLRTPAGTFSGWIPGGDEYYAYATWFEDEYPQLTDLLYSLTSALWEQPDLVEVFDQEWNDDSDWGDDDIDFEPTGT